MIDERPIEEGQPRRAASARFVVEGGVGPEAELREAMDTAHKSLADSLRLSFRAVQAVMVVLVVLYVISGFRSIEDGQSGVATVFGAINGQGLEPGLKATWPAPIGGFEVFWAENRQAADRSSFMPRIDARLSPEQRIEKARARDGLQPGRDGSLVTADGELAHLQISATWEVVDPVRYARTVPDSLGEDLVQLALEQAAVRVAGRAPLQEFLDQPLEQLRDTLRITAQATLSGLDCGIRIVDVALPAEPRPPLFIQKSYSEFDKARVEAQTAVERATSEAHELLIGAAGSEYQALVDLIDAYERSVDLGDAADRTAALGAINEMLGSDRVSGTAANYISAASGYRGEVETTLGRDYQRFASLLPTFREHPNLVVRDRWLGAFKSVIGRQDIEVMYVPKHVGGVRIDIRGLDSVQQLRHRLDLQRREFEALTSGIDLANPFVLRASEIDLEGPSRELNIDDGSVSGRKR